MRGWASVFACLSAGAAWADLSLPSNATLQAERAFNDSEFALPSAPWDGTTVPTLPIAGSIVQQAWTLAAPGLTTVQIARPLREQLRNQGYEVLFECDTEQCGGFDFRFALDVIAPPDMYVNLADFRQLSAWKSLDDGTEEAVSLLISRSAQAGYVQITQIGANVQQDTKAEAPALRAAAPAGSLAEQLDEQGHAILDGLAFATGSSRLSDDAFSSLQDLAAYLEANPTLKVALVGHTDAEGSLDGNIALSRRRAGSVLERMATEYNVARNRMEAQGMGYLAPVASNLTEEGRTANRRVEVILTGN